LGGVAPWFAAGKNRSRPQISRVDLTKGRFGFAQSALGFVKPAGPSDEAGHSGLENHHLVANSDVFRKLAAAFFPAQKS